MNLPHPKTFLFFQLFLQCFFKMFVRTLSGAHFLSDMRRSILESPLQAGDPPRYGRDGIKKNKQYSLCIFIRLLIID